MSSRGDCPEVEIDVAGRPLRLLADSAGGPKLILNPPEWASIRDHVRVTRTGRERYPTWDGFAEADVYTIDRLSIGPVTRRNAVVWVRRNPPGDLSPLLGLGPLDDCVVVFDYAGKQFWIGRENDR
jgi:hypothetical protein